MKIKILNNIENFEEIKDVFCRTFSSAPWFDDRSDKKQLNLYIHDLIDQKILFLLAYSLTREVKMF